LLVDGDEELAGGGGGDGGGIGGIRRWGKDCEVKAFWGLELVEDLPLGFGGGFDGIGLGCLRGE